MQKVLIVFLPFLIFGLIYFIAEVNIPWEEINLFYLMAFIFHVPLMLFFVAAISLVILDSLDRKHKSGL